MSVCKSVMAILSAIARMPLLHKKTLSGNFPRKLEEEERLMSRTIRRSVVNSSWFILSGSTAVVADKKDKRATDCQNKRAGLPYGLMMKRHTATGMMVHVDSRWNRELVTDRPSTRNSHGHSSNTHRLSRNGRGGGARGCGSSSP